MGIACTKVLFILRWSQSKVLSQKWLFVHTYGLLWPTDLIINSTDMQGGVAAGILCIHVGAIEKQMFQVLDPTMLASLKLNNMKWNRVDRRNNKG